MRTLGMAIFFLLLAMISFCVEGDDKVTSKKTDEAVIERMVFREIESNVIGKTSQAEFVKLRTFVATDGAHLYVLFDRQGVSGRNIVSADCSLFVGDTIKAQFPVSHCVQNSYTMFTLKDDEALVTSVLKMNGLPLESKHTVRLQLENVVAQ